MHEAQHSPTLSCTSLAPSQSYNNWDFRTLSKLQLAAAGVQYSGRQEEALLVYDWQVDPKLVELMDPTEGRLAAYEAIVEQLMKQPDPVTSRGLVIISTCGARYERRETLKQLHNLFHMWGYGLKVNARLLLLLGREHQLMEHAPIPQGGGRLASVPQTSCRERGRCGT
jgi:hypothetical protein